MRAHTERETSTIVDVLKKRLTREGKKAIIDPLCRRTDMRNTAQKKGNLMMLTKEKKKAILLTSVLALLLILVIALYIVAVSIYDGSFCYRYMTSEKNAFSISDFPAMERERHTFTSNKKQTLVGYLYKNPDASVSPKGMIVFAHGLGAGGQCGYLDIFDIMVQAGYTVFAYDATANDESEGEIVGGLPQGYIDLDHALRYVKSLDAAKDLPLLLLGYSWGGLSVTNVLNYHPDVTAVVSLAGWNKSMDLIDYRGTQMVGGVAKLLLPFGALHEYFLYGGYASSTSLKGLANSDCGVMIVHGEKDTTIPIGYGYEAYYEKYSADERFIFKKYDDRTHDLLHTADGAIDRELFAEIVSFYDSYIAKCK